MYHIVPVSRSPEQLEPLGTKRKFWYRDESGVLWLFKAEERGTGEDWAEKVACELAGLLGLPHVPYELAEEQASKLPGVICPRVGGVDDALMLGNQLLLAQDASYPVQSNEYRVKKHSIAAVAKAVQTLALPPAEWCSGMPAEIDSALAVFAGYAMLDAWIANQDRHHENWAALRAGEKLHLAPTFDHGAALARNLSDAEREERLTTKDRGRHIKSFVRRARSAFFATEQAAKPMGTVAAWQAFADLVSPATDAWLARLAAIRDEQIEACLLAVPPHRLSPIAREFTLALLYENRQRLLTGDEP
jgi:hypothetical protein